jgi:hypothetical protein
MNPRESRIVAHICGDGWLTTYIEKNSLQIVNNKRYHQKRRRYQIGYCNTCNELLKEFEEDIQKQFNIKPQKKTIEIRTRSKRIFDRISELGGGNSRKWFICQEILNSKENIRIQWIRAFFDDECTFEKKTGRIRIKSVNKIGLKQIKQLLKDLKIESNITGPNIDKTHYLTINKKNIIQFNNKIKLKHKDKNKEINKFIKNNT